MRGPLVPRGTQECGLGRHMHWSGTANMPQQPENGCLSPSPPCPLAPSSDAPVSPLPKLCIADGPAPSFMRASLFARLPAPMAEPVTAAVRARV